MNLEALRDAFKANVDEALGSTETDTVFYILNDVDKWLNAGVCEVAKRIPPEALEDLQEKATGTGASFSLPTGHLRPVACISSGDVLPIVDNPATKLLESSAVNSTFNKYCLIWGGTVTLPTSGNYTYYYIKTPAVLSTTTDVPEIPDVYHYAVVLYATYLGLLRNEVVENNYFNLFIAALGEGGQK